MTQKTFIQTVQAWYRNLIRNSKYRWIVVLGSLLYLISPLDISPDVFPIIGWLDDGLIATLLVTEISQMLFEQFSAKRKRSDDEEADVAPAAEVIDVEAVSVQ
jgi:uncharacterized membrane protein YkvA (DUF1232 family)